MLLWRVKQSLTLEYETNRLFRNVGNQLPINTAYKSQMIEDLIYTAEEAPYTRRKFLMITGKYDVYKLVQLFRGLDIFV